MWGWSISQIQYLRLDATNDPILQPQSSLVDIYAVTQAIYTRLLLFKGEWWESLQLGTPMFQSILGSPGTARNQQVMAGLLNNVVQGTPFVSSVQDGTVRYDGKTRRFTYSATANTAFGPVAISTNLGSSASIGGNS
jgi:hypothetical protein